MSLKKTIVNYLVRTISYYIKSGCVFALGIHIIDVNFQYQSEHSHDSKKNEIAITEC